MSTITATVSASARIIPVSAGTVGVIGAFYSIDSEGVLLRGFERVPVEANVYALIATPS